jgi:hypothetical protein
MGRRDGNSNMLVLKLGCVCFCLFSLLLLMPGFHSVRPHSHLRDIVSLLNAIIVAVGFYGIHRRARLTWQLGWFVGGILLSEWLVFCLSATLRLPKPNGWIVSTVIVVAGLAVALYWGYWWKRQKSYFIPN